MERANRLPKMVAPVGFIISKEKQINNELTVAKAHK